jgi:hypothetical protein
LIHDQCRSGESIRWRPHPARALHAASSQTRLARCRLQKTYRRLTLRRQIGFQIRPIGEAPQYHAARIAAQNLELRRIAVAPEDFIATLVPAESASAQPAAEARVTLGAKVPAEVATQVRKLAGRRGVSGSTLITSD